MNRQDFERIADQLPKAPGVYKFVGDQGEIIYVGKAKSLKNRIASYFNAHGQMYHKTRVMVKNANRVEYILVDSEQDALLLESSLIKKYQPRYNVSLKDGKSYSYLCIKNEPFPRVFFTRRPIKDGSTYFGPYTSKWRMKQILDIVRQIFPLRTCNLNLSPKALESGKYKVCLEYHIHNCMGPCQKLETQSEYDEKITQIKNILKGDFGPVKEYINEKMWDCANKMQYELAQKWKEKLDLFEDYQFKSTVASHSIQDVDVFSIAGDDQEAYVQYIKVVNGMIIHSYLLEMKKNLSQEPETLLSLAVPYLREKFQSQASEIIVPIEISLEDSGISVKVPKKGDKFKLLELCEKNVQHFIKQKRLEAINKGNKQSPVERKLKTLMADLNMEEMPFHIECFDNSNIQGTNPVASCVVFLNARPVPKEYRHFHIKTVEGANDFASMEEVVYRRYKRLLEEGKSLPQLIIIDGGKGQLNAAVNSLRKLNIQDRVTVIGIAKKLEEIYFPDDPVPIHINKKSESLKLIQQARNEAHRFALNFHRSLRSKNAGKTALENIKGIGPETAKKLIRHYESMQALQQAGYDSWVDVAGKSIAGKLKQYFDDSGHI